MSTQTTIYRRLVVCVLVAIFAAVGCDEASSQHDENQDEGGHEEHGEHEGHDEASTPGEIALEPEAIEQAGIEVGAVETGSLRDNARVTATVEHDINRVAHIAPLAEGQIADVRATLGEEVESGQILAVMRSVELGEARAAVHEAKAALDVARQNFERQEKLVDKGIAAERSFVEARGQLKTAQARYDAARSKLRTLGVSGGRGPTYPLKSHINGTIIEQHASVGETKGPQDELFVVADQSEVWVIGRVAEKDAHQVRPGMPAQVTLDAYPGKQWTGSVDWIGSTVDSDTRLLPIRVELDNPESQLKPGMFGAITLSAGDAAKQVPMVPVGAVQQLDGKSVVFVPGEHDGDFRAQPVELGAEGGGKVEIVSGLSPDSQVVIKGAFDVKAAMTAAGRSAAHHH